LPKRDRSTAAQLKSRLDDLKVVATSFPYYSRAAAEALSGDMGQIIRALPTDIPRPLILFRQVFREWWELDLQRHRRFFLDTSRAVDVVRGTMLDRVSKAAGKLCDELAMLDDTGRAQVGFWAVTYGVDLKGKIRTPGEAEEWLAAIASQNLPAAVGWLERFVERRPERFPQWPDRTIEWLAGLAATGGIFDKGKARSGWRHNGPGQPRALLADAVVFDLAALFEWVTGSTATRRTQGRDTDPSDYGRPYGPFHTFASAVWPLIFGSSRGLLAADKRQAKAHRQSSARSQVIATIAARHPEWRLFDEDS
jgi:hypothetical protein